MKQEIKIGPSEDLAYWLGVVQSDGSLHEYFPKGKKHSEIELAFGVCIKSLPMLEKVRRFGIQSLKRHGKIYKIQKRDEWRYHIKIKQLIDSFKKLDIKFGDPPVPPKWTLKKSDFFGAYLAGVIDGDGCVVIKRPKYPQCVIQISSGSKQIDLREALKKVLVCSAYISFAKRESYLKGRKIIGSGYRLDFYVSSKTSKFILDFVIPHLQLIHKKEKLQEFISKRYSHLFQYPEMHQYVS